MLRVVSAEVGYDGGLRPWIAIDGVGIGIDVVIALEFYSEKITLRRGFEVKSRLHATDLILSARASCVAHRTLSGIRMN